MFPISSSDRPRPYQVYSLSNKLQTWAASQMMDASGPVRRMLIKSLIADGPTIAALLGDESAMTDWIRSTVLGHFHPCASNRMGAPDDPGAVCSITPSGGKAKARG